MASNFIRADSVFGRALSMTAFTYTSPRRSCFCRAPVERTIQVPSALNKRNSRRRLHNWVSKAYKTHRRPIDAKLTPHFLSTANDYGHKVWLKWDNVQKFGPVTRKCWLPVQVSGCGFVQLLNTQDATLVSIYQDCE